MAYDPFLPKNLQTPKRQTKPGVIYDDNVIPDAEGNSEVGNIEAALSGIFSGSNKSTRRFCIFRCRTFRSWFRH
jgi:hypothetical protein